MTIENQVYKCEVCGNIIEVLHSGANALVCCGQPMNLQKEKQEDQGNEKHIPIIEKISEGFIVKVGSVRHPMTEEHFIEWIELIADGIVYRKKLKSTDNPAAKFGIKAEKVLARSYCNLHGLWTS